MSERSSTLAADRIERAPWATNGTPRPAEPFATVSIDGPMSYLFSSVSEVTERLLVEARLGAETRKQSAIQRHLAAVANRLAGAANEAIDDVIVAGLKEIGEAFEADGAVLWRTGGDSSNIPSHSWSRPGTASPEELAQLAFSPFIASKIAAGEPLAFSRIEMLPDADRQALLESGLQSAAVVPVAEPQPAADTRLALAFGTTTSSHEWAPGITDQMRLISGLFGLALARKTSHEKLQAVLDELRQARRAATADEATPVRPAIRVLSNTRLVVSESPIVCQALAQVEQVAPTPSTVLLLGETGVGKEVFAQAIHELSSRQSRQMVRVSCAAIPSALIESELFGRERGAYTGALSRQIGRFEAAHQSTLFLDEIGELSPEVQVKLLRVLQERVIERLGSNQQIKVDVRIIAATNKNLEKAVEDHTFREDLFYRLNVFPIVIPPLRERVEDIPGLVWEFVNQCSKSIGKRIESISKESMRQLQLYSWPGNVRELRNVIERAVIVANGPHLTIPVPQPSLSRQPKASMTLKSLEIEHIRATLERTNWRIRGPLGAAERLGLKPTTLETRMAKLGLVRPK